MRYAAFATISFGLLVAFADAAKDAPARRAAQEAKAAKSSDIQPAKLIPYKTAKDAKGNAVTLNLHVFLPEGYKAEDKRPAIVFFFGGGWVGGSPSQFYPQSQYLASRGMVAMAAEYRVKSRHGTTPVECVADGRSAIRYVRAHARELGVDPDRIAAGGGSAGGHVAAATATVTAFDEPAEDASVSATPNALVLFNPVYNNGPEGGWGHKTVEGYWQKISPAHNIRKGMPPAIVFLGTKDKLIPVETARKFQADMRQVGSRSELMLFEGGEHGFFNASKGGAAAHAKTLFAADEFLASLGWLSGKPTLTIPEAAGEK